MLRKLGGEMGSAAINSPRMRAALMWGLPFLSFTVVTFAPAGIQLSFCVASFMSVCTSAAMRSPNVRATLRMEPLEPRPQMVSIDNTTLT